MLTITIDEDIELSKNNFNDFSDFIDDFLVNNYFDDFEDLVLLHQMLKGKTGETESFNSFKKVIGDNHQKF